RLRHLDAHSVKRTVDKEKRDHKEDSRQHAAESRSHLVGQAHRQFHRQQTEQGGELDHRVECDGGSILEGIAHGVADHRGGVQFGSLLLQFHFYDLLGIVPGAPGVSHEDGLVEAEGGDGNQVTHEEERLHEGEGQSGEEHAEEDDEHALLRILGADGHHPLAVGDGGFLHAFQLDVLFYELHRPVSSGGYRLSGGAGKPVDDGSAGDQAKHKGSVQEREHAHVGGEAVGQRHDDGKDHGGCADHGGADEHGLGGGFEGITGPVVSFQQVLGALEVHRHLVIALDFAFHTGNLFDQ